ncbi:expressed protein [Phakopsora pachyrhizi]|uniref:Expressed protein n=1 Tax=Phakopsora pachyrhizi TaxID=170000 RepID=A0AAV0ALF4_PHAPC|nr:expressed protein [Phakopsora pachyrhizi]
MKVWIREILFASVVSTLEFTYQPVSEEGFISRLVDEVASSHSFDPVLSKDNVQTQSKQQLNPSRIYSQTETPLSTSNIEVEDFRRAGKSKRKFEGVFSTQIEGARAMNQNPWAQADFNWDFDNFGSTFYHLGRPSESDNSLVWNAQHQISPGRYKRLCSTNYPSSFLTEFEDLEDLGSFSKNSDYWNSFIEKLRPEATSELSDILNNDEAGKILPVVPPLNPTSISNLETKIKKGIAFSEQNSPPDLGKLKSCNAPNHSSSDEENYIKKYLDKLFKILRPRLSWGDQGAILDIKSSTFKDEGISGNIKKHQEDPCAYGT